MAMPRTIWTWCVAVATTAVCAVLAIVVGAIRPGSHATLRLGRVWSRAILAAAGIRVEYERDERGFEALPCLFLCNHQSILDVWAILPALPDATCFVAKQSLFRVPLLGRAMAAGGFVPVDRADRTRARESLGRAGERLRAGRSLVMFPEGTRSRDGRLGPFKKGPFHLAVAAGARIVPVTVSGSGPLLPPGSLRIGAGTVRVRFAAPIDAALWSRDDLDGLARCVRRAIEERLPAAAGGPSTAESS
jgi:1-acyl-sn-glycerol-3-phosphate acyltransferase